MLDPFRSFVLFPSLPHAARAVGALPEREGQSHPGTLNEEGKQLNLDSNRACHALALVMGKGFNSASWSHSCPVIFFFYSVNILIKDNKQ